MTHGFELAESQIREIERESLGTVSLERVEEQRDYLSVRLNIGFPSLETVHGGLEVRPREKFDVEVPRNFPFCEPTVRVPHTRFAHFAHVLCSHVLCLYVSPTDWVPHAGMFGFIRRLDAWIRDAARNNLDPEDAPLHPPVTYSIANQLVVPKANTPEISNSNWFGVAELQRRHNRIEIVDWKRHDEPWPAHFALTILLHRKFPFEYPKTVGALLTELSTHGVDSEPLLHLLELYARRDATGLPLMIVLGTPMRRPDPQGLILQHLVAWQLSANDTNQLREMGQSLSLEDHSQKNSRKKAMLERFKISWVRWCPVLEMRPEVTRRRDTTTSMSWFHGKRVAIWGCGAIGSNAAEFVVRAGASHVELIDNKVVTPGILVRQGFEDADIGRPKSEAMFDRLMRINPSLSGDHSRADLIDDLVNASPIPEVDLIIDCTASLSVRSALEYRLQGFDSSRPPIASLAVDSDASAALATLSKPNHSGCSLDLIRKLKLEACRRSELDGFLEAFWPDSGLEDRFQPEPGCSEPTFVGSHADLAGLTARMLNSLASELQNSQGKSGSGWMFKNTGSIHGFSWPSDLVLTDTNQNYSVRVCPLVEREMRAWSNRSSRLAGAKVETGGLVFGELDEAARVVWATEVDGPPRDSHSSETHFTCGTDGTREAAEGRKRRFHGSVECIGSWHTHPTSSSMYSKTDELAAKHFLSESGSYKSSCLQLILAGGPTQPELGAHLFKRSPKGNPIVSVNASRNLGCEPKKPKSIGLALSGGGSRAIAFHLGCLRALNDLDLLDAVQVISSVSGGSVIAAMYAYSTDSFTDFDERVVALLRRGIQWDIIRRAMYPRTILNRLCTRLNRSHLRAYSRSEAFRDVLADKIIGNCLVRDVGRENLDVVINTTELQTGAAFRFGSQQSGCWRYGTIPDEEALVADAVAASAAYPLLLPALERSYQFTRRGRTSKPNRILLADGGVFENLGIGPMEPGRDASISTNVFNPRFIISCDAGTGLFDTYTYPTALFGRVRRSADIVFKKTQDAARNRLHLIASHDALEGFVLCYLGQQDGALPWIPSGLPLRDEVKHYKTNFAAMSKSDICQIASRGELLMRFLCAFYLSDA